MDANDVKNKFFDIAPPASLKKPTELNMQNRQIMVNDPTEPSKQEAESTKGDTSAPIQVRRELVIGPIKQPEPAVVIADDIVERQVLAEAAAKPEVIGSPIIVNRKIVTSDDTEIDQIEADLSKEQPEADTSNTTEPAETLPVVAKEDDTLQQPEVKPVISPPSVEPLPEAAPLVEETKQETNEVSNVSETIEDKDTAINGSFASVDGLPDANIAAANKIKDGMQEPKIYDTTAYHVPIKETVHGHGGVKGAFIFGSVFAVVVVSAIVFVMYKISS